MIKILPSLASANQLYLKKELEKVDPEGCIHIDIEDGNFVPNITFGMKTIKSVCAEFPAMKYDAHLMVTEPEGYIEPLSELGFSAIAFHWEAAPYPMRMICKIHNAGMKAGIALNPRTYVEEIEDYLEHVDYILLMASEPDDSGEKFQKNILKKVKYLKTCKEDLEIIVDGGVNAGNINSVVDAGTDGVVLGRAFFQGNDLEKLIGTF